MIPVEEIETIEEVQDPPINYRRPDLKIPYVTFQSLKFVNEKGQSKSKIVRRKSTWHIDVSGCHNSVASLEAIEKSGAVLIGSNNLVPNKNRDIIPWIRSRLGESVHPALRTNAMEVKIAAAQKALAEEGESEKANVVDLRTRKGKETDGK